MVAGAIAGAFANYYLTRDNSNGKSVKDMLGEELYYDIYWMYN